MPVSYSGTAITWPDSSTTTSGWTGFKNRIINGAMMIDQRNAGASTTPSATASNIYTLDRWFYFQSQASKFAIQQNAGSVTTPAGFPNYLGLTSQSAYSVVSSDYFGLGQIIEGFNTADLAWGTANAAAVTLSFKVYSSLTGTFGGSIQNPAQNRSYPFTYTVSSANTWTTINITVSGDTSGTWVGASNSGSIRINFGLGMGSSFSGTAGSWAGANYLSATGATSVVGTNGATFYITGVQLERGSTASSFDYRPYGTELALCQRYFEKSLPQSVAVANGFGDYRPWYGPAANGVPFAVVKRATPTMAAYYGLSGSNGQWNQFNGGAWVQFTPDIGASTANWYFAGGSYNIIIGAWTASAEL